jgi:hypothetical protein
LVLKGDIISVKDLDIVSPTGDLLVEKLTFDVKTKESDQKVVFSNILLASSWGAFVCFRAERVRQNEFVSGGGGPVARGARARDETQREHLLCAAKTLLVTR